MLARLLVLLLALVPALAYGDGMAYKGSGMSAFAPLRENEQAALIAHRNGRQKMLLAINVNLEAKDSGLWIVPVPGTPDAITFDLTDRFPVPFGVNPRREVHAAIETLSTHTGFTQLPFCCLLLPSLGSASGGSFDATRLHASVERYGLRSELIAPRTLDELQSFLQAKSITVPAEHLASFAPYLSNQFSLIVTTIQSRNQIRQEFPNLGSLRFRTPCLFLTFPTEHPFFPLRPTAGYGDETIRVRLWFLGLVAPDTADHLRKAARVNHYLFRHFRRASGFPPATLPAAFDLPSGEPSHFTTVSLEIPARDLTADLSFTPIPAPWSAHTEALHRFLETTPDFVLFVLALLYIALLSMLSGALTGLLVHRRARPYAYLALWNLMTIFGLLIRLHYYHRSPPRLRAPIPPRILAFLGVFMVTFLSLTLACHYVLLWLT